MSVSKRLRFEVMRRDGHRCLYCGRDPDDGVKLTIDHVVPAALGGTDDPSNLCTACTECNAGKSSIQPDGPLVARVSAEALRWAHAREQAIAAWHAKQEDLDSQCAQFREAWDEWRVGHSDEPGRPVPIPSGWRDSVERWLDEGLTVADLCRMTDTAMGNTRVGPDSTWRYLCGIVWRTLDKLQDSTTDNLREGYDG